MKRLLLLALLLQAAPAWSAECDIDVSAATGSWPVTMTGLRKLTNDPGNDYVLACRDCDDILLGATVAAVDARDTRPTDGALALENEQSFSRMLRDERRRAEFLEKYRASIKKVFRECSVSADFGEALIVDGVALIEVHSMWNCPGARVEWRRRVEMLGYRNGCGYSLNIGWLDRKPLSHGDKVRVQSLLSAAFLRP